MPPLPGTTWKLLGKAAHLAVWLPAGQEVWIRPGGGAAPIFRDHPRQAYPTALLARWSSRLTGSLTITYHSDLGYSPSNGKLLFFGREFQSLIKPSRLGVAIPICVQPRKKNPAQLTSCLAHVRQSANGKDQKSVFSNVSARGRGSAQWP